MQGIIEIKPTGSVIRKSAMFFTGLLVFWMAGVWLLASSTKEAGFLLLRFRGDATVDFFFRYITHLGDGLFVIAICLLLIWRKMYAAAFVLLFGYAVSGIIAQVIKETFVSPRPAAHFLLQGVNLEPVRGVELMTSKTSFPSGHTASAFSLATALVMMFEWWRRRWWLALFAAVLIGYSRIYLGQHFPQDVLGGSVLGVLATVGGYALLAAWKPRFLQRSR